MQVIHARDTIRVDGLLKVTTSKYLEVEMDAWSRATRKIATVTGTADKLATDYPSATVARIMSVPIWDLGWNGVEPKVSVQGEELPTLVINGIMSNQDKIAVTVLCIANR